MCAPVNAAQRHDQAAPSRDFLARAWQPAATPMRTPSTATSTVTNNAEAAAAGARVARVANEHRRGQGYAPLHAHVQYERLEEARQVLTTLRAEQAAQSDPLPALPPLPPLEKHEYEDVAIAAITAQHTYEAADPRRESCGLPRATDWS